MDRFTTLRRVGLPTLTRVRDNDPDAVEAPAVRPTGSREERTVRIDSTPGGVATIPVRLNVAGVRVPLFPLTRSSILRCSRGIRSLRRAP